ncbi:MAG: ATP-binding protein [Nitrososphaerales archaeon]
MELNLTPTDLHTLLVATIKAKQNVMVVGPPGVGKTHIEAQAAKAAGVQNFQLFPSIGDPTDAKGFPFVIDGCAEFIPFGELRRVYKAIDESKDCVLNLEDLGQATMAVQASYMALMDRLRGKCAIVATTNQRVKAMGVQGLLEPVKSRFHTIVVLAPNLDDFCNHLIDHGVDLYGLDEEIIIDLVSFLRFRPDLLCTFNPSLDIVNSSCPRTLIGAGQIAMLRLPSHVEFIAIAGALGAGPGGELQAFRRMRKELADLDSIIMDPYNAIISEEPSVAWAICTGLAVRATPQNFSKIHIYAHKLMEAGLGQFTALLIRDCMRRNPDIMETLEFKQLAMGKVGNLIMGNLDK